MISNIPSTRPHHFCIDSSSKNYHSIAPRCSKMLQDAPRHQWTLGKLAKLDALQFQLRRWSDLAHARGERMTDNDSSGQWRMDLRPLKTSKSTIFPVLNSSKRIFQPKKSTSSYGGTQISGNLNMISGDHWLAGEADGQ